jgi:flagellar biogenesis protein FliO
MNHSTVSRRRNRLDDKLRAAFLPCVILVCLGTPTGGHAEEPAVPPQTLNTAAVLSNQGVTLPRQQAEDAPDSAERTDRAAANGTPEQESVTESVILRRPSPPHGARRTVGATEGRLTPWYRTGLGALGIVLALIAVAVYAVRRWVPAARITDGGALRVIARAGLSPKHGLALIQVGRRLVLIGISGDRMTGLSEVTDPDEVAELLAQPAAGGRRQSSELFGDLLRQEARSYVRPGRSQPKDADPQETSVARTQKSLTDLLSRLRSVNVG